MKVAVIALGMLLVLPSLAVGQAGSTGCEAGNTARALCASEVALTEAWRQNDIAKLSELYADDCQLINYRGRKIDRTGVLAALRSGLLRFDSLATSDVQVRIYGGAGLVSGVQHQVAREPGGDNRAHSKDVRYTHVYLLREGRWRLVASQITPIVSAPPGP